MKPLVLALVSAFLLVPAMSRAQLIRGAQDAKDHAEELSRAKKESAEQIARMKKEAQGASDAQAPKKDGRTVAEMETLLLGQGNCQKGSVKLAPGLEEKFGLVSCLDPVTGLNQILIVPATVVPEQRLMYASVPGYKLLRARLVDHFMVIEFDKQKQYLDLVTKGLGDGAHFDMAGFVADGSFRQFRDVGIFLDALKNFGDVKEGSEILAKLPNLIEKSGGIKNGRLEAAKINGSWIVVVISQGNTNTVWPEKKKP